MEKIGIDNSEKFSHFFSKYTTDDVALLKSI